MRYFEPEIIEMKKHLQMLDYLIKNTNDKTINETLTFAYNRIFKDVWQEEAGKRREEEWPVCAKCGKPYGWSATNDDHVHDVIPACKCGADIVWREKRPAGMWKEVKSQIKQLGV